MEVSVLRCFMGIVLYNVFCGYLCSTGCYRVSSMCGFVIVQCVVGVFVLSIVRVCVI